MIESPRPSPGILRTASCALVVGRDCYLARSTFEWFPGVEILSSRDQRRFESVPRQPGTAGMVDLRGVPAGGGVRALCLSHAFGQFHLVYTLGRDEAGRDLLSFLVTAADVRGPWSEPVLLFEGGFALSQLNDADGSKWLLIAVPDAGTIFRLCLVRLLLEEQRLEDDPEWIDPGNALDLTRGVRLAMHGSDYFLTGATADGRACVLRSDRREGPYMADPSGPIPGMDGACGLIEGRDGQWMLFHGDAPSTGQNAPGVRFHKVCWSDDGWPRIQSGDLIADSETSAPDDTAADFYRRYEFFGTLDGGICSLRVPPDRAICSLWARPGFLRLYGRASILSREAQSFLAAKVCAAAFCATTELEYEPRAYLQAAGLCLRRAERFFYLQVTWHDRVGRCARLMVREGMKSRLSPSIPLEDGPVRLRMDLTGGAARFFVRTLFDDDWTEVAPDLAPIQSRILSDEAYGFDCAGVYLGLCCQDQTGSALPADFRFLDIARPD
jgi:xylan 1,4-beta-xylosidase